MGDFKAAIADYDSALKLEPDLAWSLYMRGLAKDALGPASAGTADRTAATALQADVADRAVEYHIGG
jgi:tetratricopeptide (TPR) repeat protein